MARWAFNFINRQVQRSFFKSRGKICAQRAGDIQFNFRVMAGERRNDLCKFRPPVIIRYPQAQFPTYGILRNVPMHRVQASGVPGNGWLAYGAAAPTIDLGAIGAPGCSVYTSANFLVPFTGDANGEATLEFRIPNLASLAGSTFYQQVIA